MGKKSITEYLQESTQLIAALVDVLSLASPAGTLILRAITQLIKLGIDVYTAYLLGNLSRDQAVNFLVYTSNSLHSAVVSWDAAASAAIARIEAEKLKSAMKPQQSSEEVMQFEDSPQSPTLPPESSEPKPVCPCCATAAAVPPIPETAADS